MFQKYLPSFILLSGLIFLQPPILATPKTTSSPQRVLVFGDSISAAYNIQRELGWVSLLQDFVHKQQLPIEIINASISGETTSGGLSRIEHQLEQFQPSVVILELGGNDGLRGFDLAETQRNLTQMISLIQAKGAHVLLAGMQLPPNMGRTYTSRFATIFSQLAEHQDVTLIPLFLEDVATRPNLMQADGIHPNVEGQPMLMEKVWQYLKPVLQSQRSAN